MLFFNEHAAHTFARSSALLLEPARQAGVRFHGRAATRAPEGGGRERRPPRGAGGPLLTPLLKTNLFELRFSLIITTSTESDSLSLFQQVSHSFHHMNVCVNRNVCLCVYILLAVDCNCCWILSQRCWASGVTLQRSPEGSPVPS